MGTINEEDLPTTNRSYGVSVSYPQSHSVSYTNGNANIVVGPRGEKGEDGAPGPPGPQGQWDSMTQAEYDALPSKNPDTLYVIVP